MEQAGFVTLFSNVTSDTRRVQLSLIWIASMNLSRNWLEPELLNPFAKGWTIHEENAMVTMLLRIQAMREIQKKSQCTLLELRPGAFANANTATRLVNIPLSSSIQHLYSLPKFYLQNGTDVLPMTLPVGDASESAVTVSNGGLFRAAPGQGKW